MTALWSDLPLLFQSSATTSGRTCPRERTVRAKRSKRERESARERSDATCSSAGPVPLVLVHGKRNWPCTDTENLHSLRVSRVSVCFVLALPSLPFEREWVNEIENEGARNPTENKKRARVEFSRERERGANRQVKAERRKTMISVTTPPVVCAPKGFRRVAPSHLWPDQVWVGSTRNSQTRVRVVNR